MEVHTFTVKVLPLEDFVDSSCLSVEEVGFEVPPKVMALGGPSLCLTLSVLEVGAEVALTFEGATSGLDFWSVGLEAECLSSLSERMTLRLFPPSDPEGTAKA